MIFELLSKSALILNPEAFVEEVKNIDGQSFLILLGYIFTFFAFIASLVPFGTFFLNKNLKSIEKN